MKIYQNVSGKLKDTTDAAGLTQWPGWWLCLISADVDRDGDMDLIAGNFGLNTKYKATTEKPELLFFGDIDGGGMQQIVEAKDLLAAAEKFSINTLESGIFRNNGKGSFTFQPLPRAAQIAPVHGLAAMDADRDGTLDVVLSQNFWHPQRETGRMAGGTGLVLHGNGDGTFSPLSIAESGVLIPGDARGLIVSDLNQDGHPDFVVAENNGPVRAFLAQPQVGKNALEIYANAFRFLSKLQSRETEFLKAIVSFRKKHPSVINTTMLLGAAQSDFMDEFDRIRRLPEDSVFWTETAIIDRKDNFEEAVQQAVKLLQSRSSVLQKKIEETRIVTVRLKGAKANPSAIGARVSIGAPPANYQTSEVTARSGWLSQSTSVLSFYFPTAAHDLTVKVRWPDGTTTLHRKAPGPILISAKE